MDDVYLLAQEIDEANKLSEKDAKILRQMQVSLRNPVLPQHQIESRAGSRPPTHDEVVKFEEFAAIKRGSFDPSEDKIINNNWKAFCKLHNWKCSKVQQFLVLRIENTTHIRSKKQRRMFVQFLADGLPNRTLYSVYHRFRNLYAERLQRRFQPDEDEMILNHLERNPNLDEKRKYSELAKVLKRTRVSIWRRYRLLKKNQRMQS